jgi:hypothetical protein
MALFMVPVAIVGLPFLVPAFLGETREVVAQHRYSTRALRVVHAS